ncbi:hypothetical protein SRABI118_04385 [Massilia sp. Bi118]|uniref:hypothetical protein n=1 Tax=Massilia sp. Bi118 TaxID=2822346 RepID=UPI001D5C9895|nr:hypothetical protein [Massilia sp. Bi118]CAH0300587.1 hypothetical protein SRABI118_04385 [Massilia sp. Bi118]
MNVHASLSIDARHEKVLVTFKIENRGERRIGVPREIAVETELTRRLFELRQHPGDAEVLYLARTVKRVPLGLDDYVELAPHSAHTHTIDITRAFAFRPGTNTYVIRYESTALEDVRRLDTAVGFTTASVMFSHTER